MTVSVNEVPLATITAEAITQIGEDLSSSHVVSGLAGSDGGGTTLAVAEGTARIAGYRAITDAAVNQVLTDDSVNYIYFSLTTDASARVTGAEFVDSPTTLAVDTRLLLAKVTCATGAITGIVDERVYKPISNVDIRDVDAATVTIGILPTGVIPDLDADKITTGTLTLAAIPTTLTGKTADKVDDMHGILVASSEDQYLDIAGAVPLYTMTASEVGKYFIVALGPNSYGQATKIRLQWRHESNNMGWWAVHDGGASVHFRFRVFQVE